MAKDTALNLGALDVADNIDLDLIFQEFEDYYQMKFGKRPKLVSRRDAGSVGGGSVKASYGIMADVAGRAAAAAGGAVSSAAGAPGGRGGAARGVGTTRARNGSGASMKAGAGGSGGGPGAPSQQGSGNDVSESARAKDGVVLDHGAKVAATGAASSAEYSNQQNVTGDQEPPNFEVVATKIAGRKSSVPPPKGNDDWGNEDDPYLNRVRKPMPAEFHYTSELRELARVIERDICTRNPGVSTCHVS